MPSFYNLTSGTVAQAQDVQQLISALNGTAGLGVPLSPTAVNDSVNFALAVKNLDTTNSRALQVVRANNTVLLQADVNGLIGSVDGTTAPAQLVNVSLAQTLTNKNLQSVAAVGIGGSPVGVTALGISGNATSGGSTQAAVSVNNTFPSSATGQIVSFASAIVTAATAFTVNEADSFLVNSPTVGAGSSITSLYGLKVNNLGAAGITNAYGVYIVAQSGASATNVGLYNNGTSTFVGAFTAQGGGLFQGTAPVGSGVGFGGNVGQGNGSAATLPLLKGTGFGPTSGGIGWVQFNINSSIVYFPYWT